MLFISNQSRTFSTTTRNRALFMLWTSNQIPTLGAHRICESVRREQLAYIITVRIGANGV